MASKNADPLPAEPEPPSGDGASAPLPAIPAPVVVVDGKGSPVSPPIAAEEGNGASPLLVDPLARLAGRGAHFLRPRPAQKTAPGPTASAGLWQRFASWWNGRAQRRSARKAEGTQYSTIVVERDDSLATVCGKLDTARMAQVAVVIPHGNHELGRPLGVRRLMRHAELSGKDIVLVTRNLSIRQRARVEGQPLASSVRRVRFDRLSPRGLQLGGLDLALPGLGTLMALVLLGAFLAGAFVAVFWYLPVATVTLVPRSTVVSKAQAVTIDAQTTHVNLSSFNVPAVRRQIDVTRTLYLPATGVTNVKQANGSLLPVPAVDAKDLKSAQDLAPAALTEQGLTDLRSRYGSIDTLFPESAQVQVLSVAPVQKAGDAASFLEVTVRGSVSMLAAANADLDTIFTTLLRSQVPSDQMFVDSSLQLSVLAAGPYDRGADKLPANVQAQVHVTRALDEAALARGIEGKSRRDAATYLDRTLAPIERPIVQLSPGWVPWVPRTQKHIHIDLLGK
jgi:hypothetical protein